MSIYTDQKYYVYAYLRDDQTPYYIGKGINRRAYQAHKRKNGSDMLPKDISRIKILHENLSEKQAFDLEKELILDYGRKDLGTGILRNLTEGGEGNRRTGWKHSEEAKLAMSKARIGKPSHRKGVPSPMKGVARTQETKDKIASALKGGKLTPEHRAKLSKAHKGKTLSAEHKAKLHNANKGKTLSAEHKAKIGKANKEARLAKLAATSVQTSQLDP